MTSKHLRQPATVKKTPLPAAARWCLLALAVFSLVLGIVGIFLPLLPTVPFLLLAAWAAGHSSPRLSKWLESHPRFGRPITDWRRAGVVRRRAKWSATILMTLSAASTVWLMHAHWASLVMAAAMACVLLWLWQRPEHCPP